MQPTAVDTVSTNHPILNLFTFLGGFCLNLFAGFVKPQALYLDYVFGPDFLAFLVRSIIGGMIPLLIKLLFDLIKSRRQKP